jgi:CYTH domain
MESGSGILTEIEATLVIRSEDPASIVKELAALTSIANCRLQPRDSILIRDTYFDTGPAKDKFALRIREVGRTQLITVKGPMRRTTWGAVERLEIEEVWSAESLRRAMEEIRGETFLLPVNESEFDWISPVEVMKRAGLEVLQRRETFRHVREILSGTGHTDRRIGELAIDSGIYHFLNLDVLHYEVEIESKGEEEAEMLKAVLDGLVSAYGEDLLPWEWNKLSTGLALETILGRLPREALLDENNVVLPKTYELIDRELRQLP